MDDPAADFPDFVRMSATALLRSAYLLTGNRVDAEELVQDTLVRLYPRWDRVSAADVPLAYVRRSLANNYLNTRRRRSAADLLLAEPPESGFDPDLAGRVSERDLLRRLLERLSPRQRAVLVLRFYEDLDDEQIAAALGCRRGTVRSIVSRALGQLRAEVERRADGADGSGPRMPETNGRLR